MKLPKYIQNKIKQQNDAVFKAQKLEKEIEDWCDKSGIDIWSDEYKEKVKAPYEEGVGALNGNAIAELYQ